MPNPTEPACGNCQGPMHLVTVRHRNGRVTRWHACPTCRTARSADKPAPKSASRPNLRLVRGNRDGNQ